MKCPGRTNGEVMREARTRPVTAVRTVPSRISGGTSCHRPIVIATILSTFASCRWASVVIIIVVIIITIIQRIKLVKRCSKCHHHVHRYGIIGEKITNLTIQAFVL